MDSVSNWMMKINLSMINDRIVPIRKVKRSVGTHYAINWAKCYPCRGSYVVFNHRRIGASVNFYRIAVNIVCAKVRSNDAAAPVFRKMFTAHDDDTG